MTTRIEKEKQKAQQEKFQAVLSSLLKDDDNKYCVDCDAKGPRWASWNLGIFMCIRCAGIHRNLGVHISKVKSVNLDTWTPEQIAMMMEVGNSRARAAYEANLPDNYRRPQTDSALESFIRAKYENKKYLAKEWVTPKPGVPRELLEDDKDKKKSKPKSSGGIQLSSVSRTQASSSVSNSQSTATNKPAVSKPTQPSHPKATTPQQPRAPPPASTNTADLIGLVFPQSAPTETVDAPTPNNNSNNLLGDLEDFMGGGVQTQSSQQPSQQNTNQVTNGSIEANLFGETGTSTPTEKVSTKDSILALYGGQQVPQQQFGVPAVSYMSQCDGMDGVTNFVTSMANTVGGVTNYYTPTNNESAMYINTDTGYMWGLPVSEQTPGTYGGVYMPQQQQQAGQQGMPGMYGMPQQMPTQQQMPQQMNNMAGMQQPMYGNQMNMMGMTGQQQQPGAMGMGHNMAGMQGQRMPQSGMAQPQGMYGQPQNTAQMQQMQYNQMNNQMAGMGLGQQGQMGMVPNGMTSGQGWGGQPSGQTLSNNLWQ